MSKILHSKILGHGKPLLILHGFLGMGDNWISLARRYAQNGFEVHLIDQRNHGKSFHDNEMNYQNMVSDIHVYLQHHKINEFNLMGHSMGGKTAMFFALDYPDTLRKLIIVDISPKYYPPHHHFIFDVINRIDLSKYTKRQEIEMTLNKKIDNLSIVRFIMKNIGRDKNGKFYWKPNIPVLETSLDDLGEALQPMSVIENPTLFIKGASSPYIQENDILLIKAHLPNSKIITINNSGHWVHAQQPELFFKETLNFLTED